MKNLLVAILFVSFSSFAAEEAADPTAPRKGFALAPTIGIDISNYSSNVTGGIGFNAKLNAQYFFVPNVGVVVGGGFTSRRFNLNSSSAVGYFEIPVGVVFQYNLRNSTRNIIGLAFVYAIPTSNFPDSGGTIALQGIPELLIPLETYFPVTENFELGLVGDVRFSLGSPFTALPTAMVFSVQLGLGARISF